VPESRCQPTVRKTKCLHPSRSFRDQQIRTKYSSLRKQRSGILRPGRRYADNSETTYGKGLESCKRRRRERQEHRPFSPLSRPIKGCQQKKKRSVDRKKKKR
jgi:hypothetical protein